MSKDQPLYTKEFQRASRIYVKNGKVLKKRGYVNEAVIDVAKEVKEYNNIVIEKGIYIDIYCSCAKKTHYKAIIDYLCRTRDLDIKSLVKIHCKPNKKEESV